MPTVIVTGSGGLIGSESVEQFVEAGYDVIGLYLDSAKPGESARWSHNQFPQPLWPSKATLRFKTGSASTCNMPVRFVLRHQFTTLLIAIATLVATIYLYVVVPKGFFPVQDTGVILGISDASQTV